eukprot:1507397-Alexandrium_andersonii.AAC.1
MSASLVGSEMCIRDSSSLAKGSFRVAETSDRLWVFRISKAGLFGPFVPVSYTHLTLPTICSV